MEKIIFEKEYEVRAFDSNCSGKLSLTALFSFLQDIAGHHAAILGFGRDDLLKSKHFWMLSRILCKLNRDPLWNEVLKIRTWPTGSEGVFAIRNLQILDSDNTIIVEASSSWIIVDSNSRRPLRPGPIINKLNYDIDLPEFKCRKAEKLPPVGENTYLSQVSPVRYSDLDINMHVNNARYLQWVTDTYPLDFLINNDPREIEINYLAEAIPGDEYVVSAEEKDNIFYHSVIKDNKKREACRVRIEWQACEDAKVY